MTQPTRPAYRVPAAVDVLVVFAPFLIPFVLVVLLVLAAAVFFFVAMIAEAFQEGFAAGCSALGALILGISLILLWLSSLLRLTGPQRMPAPTPAPRPRWMEESVESRYARGDFVHRDYEAEKAEWEAWRAEELARLERRKQE